MSKGAEWLRNQLGGAVAPAPAQQMAPAPYGGGFAAPFPAALGGRPAMAPAPAGTIVPAEMLTPELVQANPQVFIDSVATGAQRLPGVHDAQNCPSCGGELLMSNSGYSQQGLRRVNKNGDPVYPQPSCVNCGWPVVQYGSPMGEGGQAQ